MNIYFLNMKDIVTLLMQPEGIDRYNKSIVQVVKLKGYPLMQKIVVIRLSLTQ